MKFNKVDIDLLNSAGNDYLADDLWEQASVCFERLLAHIPNYFNLHTWYQYYLLDSEPPVTCSPEYVANIYAALSLCRMKQGYFTDGLQLGHAALRLWPKCMKAQIIINQFKDQETSTKKNTQLRTDGANIHSGMDKENSFGKLSILMVTNYTRKLKHYREFSPPSLGLVKATYGSMLQIFGIETAACPKWLCYDRPNKSDKFERQYEKALRNFASDHGFSLNVFEHAGLLNIISHVIPVIRTPYVLFLEHDWLFQGDPLNIPEIVSLLDQHPEIHYIRFNKRTNIIANTDFLLRSESPMENIPLLQTVSHSNTPHICRVETLRRQWLPICKSDPACEEMRIRGKAFGIENPLFKRHMAEVRGWGFSHAHRHWGTYIYGNYNEPAKIAHLGE